MTNRRCPYCQRSFTPSRYRPDQTTCSEPGCQLRRKAEYHRRKIQEDPDYRAQCRDSQRQWRGEHPNYMRNYRAPAAPGSAKALRNQFLNVVRLVRGAKNNLALDLRTCHAEILILTDGVKNNLVHAQLLVIAEVPGE